jgi:hypothetical protein
VADTNTLDALAASLARDIPQGADIVREVDSRAACLEAETREALAWKVREIRHMNDPTSEVRIDAAVGASLDAFWAAVARSFPEIPTGDVGFDSPFVDHAKAAIATWVANNVAQGCTQCGTEDVGRWVDDGPVCGDCKDA